MCMHMSLHILETLCSHAYLHSCLCTSLCACLYTCPCTCTCKCAYTCLQTCPCTYPCACLCTCLCTPMPHVAVCSFSYFNSCNGRHVWVPSTALAKSATFFSFFRRDFGSGRRPTPSKPVSLKARPVGGIRSRSDEPSRGVSDCRRRVATVGLVFGDCLREWR